ncbi:2Fe-2S iron-sulfur cluster-binding protein [Natranaeroarchaeum aerophilus]|uniref:2Fe-2S iron-sulfur cluster-binding protein n=1 Tax=Natranaeroarchaeum aerophilus TaxID=2917711 RepID=A0AAE3FP07_9EURY|nr:2Fe-2S iron-sulfur cluster-binding protein [Natranaeroarchaeum aerophilus]MCL9812723.1 2Fe-2S iron-sulfur cluster-binding protein [Natranaeroarchaeum aerophilus]
MAKRGTDRAADCDSEANGDCANCPNSDADARRRRILTGMAAGGTAAFAGCAGLFDTGEDDGPENFVSEDAEENGEENGEEAPAYELEFLRNEQTLDIGEDEIILDAGLDADLDLPYQCEVGVCGQCEAHVNGDATDVVEMDGNEYLDDSEIEDGAFLTCVAEPRADFAMDERPDESGSPLDDVEEAQAFAVEYLGHDTGGTTIDVPEDEELLYAGLDEGWDLPYQCEVGVCGQCVAEVDGDANDVVEMDGNDYLSEEEVEDGQLLTCVAQPRDDFTLDTEP